MNLPLGIVLAAALASSPVAPSLRSIVYDDLKPGQRFEIATTQQIFRGELVNPDSGECLVSTLTANRDAEPRQRMWLLGSTQGDQPGAGGLNLFLMHQIKVGMRMEVGQGSLEPANRRITSPVTSIRLISSSPAIGETALR